MIFENEAKPRLFGMPPGADFAAELVSGLRRRVANMSPETMARTELYANSGRMARRIEACFADGPPSFLPRIRLLTDTAEPGLRALLPEPVSPLRPEAFISNVLTDFHLLSKLLSRQGRGRDC